MRHDSIPPHPAKKTWLWCHAVRVAVIVAVRVFVRVTDIVAMRVFVRVAVLVAVRVLVRVAVGVRVFV
jgi:hypothetical protein